jgi:RNA polymerase sigma factor (sigma-70 family)
MKDMEMEEALSTEPSALSRSLRVAAARERGVGSGQVRWIGTDPELFEMFYREHVEDLQRFVARRIGDRERAADLTAEIFLAAIDSAHRYRPRRGTPKAWLYGIARVLVADDCRRRGRERAREERFRGSALLDADDAARIDARIDAAAQARRLYSAMDRLPEAERAVLELVALDELTVAEAAAAAGVRPVTARVRLHRARGKLRAELEATATGTSASEVEGS